MHFHKCGWCGASGPIEQPDEAPQGWNTRADITQPQAVAVEVKPLVWEDGINLHTATGAAYYQLIEHIRGWCMTSVGLNTQYFSTLKEAKAAADAANRARTLSQITNARSVDEVLEQAARHAECSFDGRPRRDDYGGHMDWTDGYLDGTRAAAAAIRALKSQPTPAPAQDEVVQRLMEAAQAISDHDYDHDFLSVDLNRKLDSLLDALTAMEGR